MRNKILLVAIWIFGFLFSATCLAQEKKQEIFIVAGEQSGIGGQFWRNPTQAIVISTSFHLFPFQYAVFDLRYQLSYASLSTKEGKSFPLYVGVGTKLGASIDNPAFVFGFSAPIGISLPFGKIFSGFVELSPGVIFLDGFEIDLDAGAGIRIALGTGKNEKGPKSKPTATKDSKP